MSASVTPTDIGTCAIGSPQADILIRATGLVVALDPGETVLLDHYANGGLVTGTHRRVTDSDGSFAMEWLFSSSGGTETFSLRSLASGGATYIVSAQITLEVVQDTRCET